MDYHFAMSFLLMVGLMIKCGCLLAYTRLDMCHFTHNCDRAVRELFLYFNCFLWGIAIADIWFYRSGFAKTIIPSIIAAVITFTTIWLGWAVHKNTTELTDPERLQYYRCILALTAFAAAMQGLRMAIDADNNIAFGLGQLACILFSLLMVYTLSDISKNKSATREGLLIMTV